MDEPTPGPWGAIQSENGEFYLDEWYVSADGVDGMVAIVNGEANARRVAAAPEMMALILKWMRLEDDCEEGDPRIIKRYARLIPEARAAIAKAKGLTE